MKSLVTILRLSSNPIFIGKLLPASTQIFVVLLASIALHPEKANSLFWLLAVSGIVTAIASFGANGAIVPLIYKNPERIKSFLFIILGGKLFICLFSAWVIFSFNLNKDISPLIFAWTSFSSSMHFIDYVAEGMGDQAVKRISKYKCIIFGVGLISKAVFFFTSFHALLITVYLEWILLWLIFYFFMFERRRVVTLPASRDFIDVGIFLTRSSWVWISSVANFGWTRAYFVLLSGDLGPVIANTYFVAVRVIEGFLIIPNALAMNYFPEMIARRQQDDTTALDRARLTFVNNVFRASIVIGLIVPCILILLSAINTGEAHSNSFPIFSAVVFSIASLFIFLRVTVSREIILVERYSLSLLSYVSGASAALLSYYIMGANGYLDAAVGYLVFAVVCFACPFFLAKKQFAPLRRALSANFMGVT